MSVSLSSTSLSHFHASLNQKPQTFHHNQKPQTFHQKTSNFPSISNLQTPPKPITTSCKANLDSSSSFIQWENIDDYDDEVFDDGSPWEGAVVYKRDATVTHVEYCTTLERLGLGKLSTEVSKKKADVMGLRVKKGVKECGIGTPVMVSGDVEKKKNGLRLDGIVRTVITLSCNRCGEPAAEPIFSNFSLLLTEEPVEEPDIINMGVIFAEDKLKSFAGTGGEVYEDDNSLIDIDDRLYFPPEEKEIDISKNIRDLVHLEITINAICDPSCKGLCLRCGTNLNIGSCSCSKREVKQKGYGPLQNLKERMQLK